MKIKGDFTAGYCSFGTVVLILAGFDRCWLDTEAALAVAVVG